jgi:hypothetical protein
MKMSLSISVVLGLLLCVQAQEPSVRDQLLQSKGNMKVSALFDEAPVLPIDDLQTEIYRITFIPTFFNPIKIRVERAK